MSKTSAYAPIERDRTEFVNKLGSWDAAHEFEALVMSADLSVAELPEEYKEVIRTAKNGDRVNGYYWGFLLQEYEKYCENIIVD